MDFHIYNQTSHVWVPVEGAEIVNIAPHLVATFVVHQCPFNRSDWKVSHVDTGCLISNSTWQEREDVIEMARAKLAKVDQKKFDKAVAKVTPKLPERPEPKTKNEEFSSR